MTGVYVIGVERNPHISLGVILSTANYQATKLKEVK